MEIRPILYAQVFADEKAADLLKAYAEECSIPEIGETNPQAEMYAQMEKAGVAQCFGVYSDSQLVGFASVLATVVPHYGKKVATVESIYVAPQFRGVNLLNVIEEYAKRRGCTAVLYSAPAYSRFARLLSLKYRHTNSVFCRSLL